MPVAQEQKPALLQKLIIFNLIWSILGIIADWSWLSYIPFQLIPFTIICSLYPPLLLIIFLLIQKGKNPPQILLWLTSIGIISYGLAAQIYFPLLMSWKGFNFHDFGSMFWVAAYGLQFFLIKKYLRPLPLIQLAIILAYFLIVNSTHYFYPTFIDFILPNYPNWLKYTTATVVIILQIFAIFLTWKVTQKNSLHKT